MNLYEIELNNADYGDEVYDVDALCIEETYRAGSSLVYLVSTDLEYAAISAIVALFVGFVSIRAMN